MAGDTGQLDSKPPCKRNARNLSEKKRRDQFNVLVLELCSMVATSQSSKMDKSTVLKATINFLRQQNEMSTKSKENMIKENWKPSFLSDDEFSQLMLEALDGFVIVYSQQGHILYASDSIMSLLCHLPKELQSSTIYELVHEDDRPEIFKVLMEADPKNKDLGHLKDKRYNFTTRMRKGALVPNKPVQYETVKFTGNFSFFKSNSDYSSDENRMQCCFVATACLQNSQLIREMTSANEKEFSSRHSLDWKFLFLDHRGPPILGYLPFEVLGTSAYEYYHQDDLEKLTQCHEALMQTGEGISCNYRYLSKGQEWIWLQTRYFVTYNQWNSKPEFIVCTHRVVSYAEVRKGLNQSMTLSDDASISADLASKWPPSDCMSEMLSLQSSSADEQSACSQKSIMSDKIYEPPRRRVSANTASHRSSQPGYAESPTVSNGGRVAPSNVHSMSPQQYHVGDVHSPMIGTTDRATSQLSTLQAKLQKQLMSRHQKLQEDIMRQQQELQSVQQQLIQAQHLILRESGISPLELGQEPAPKTPLTPNSGGKWDSVVARDQPSASEARSMNMPLHHSSVAMNPSSASSSRGLPSYPTFNAAPVLHSTRYLHHMIQSPAVPTLEGSPQPPPTPASHRENRSALPDIISNVHNSDIQGGPSQPLVFDPSQIGMSPEQLQSTSLGGHYNQLLMGGQDRFISSVGMCDDLELDPAMIPGFMD